MARQPERASSIRILGGTLRGRSIEALPGAAVRPTASRTREALFNLLLHGGYGTDGGNILAGARVADLFCGTGALAFEALSRGAASAVMCDSEEEHLRLARRNAERLGVTGNCTFLRMVLPKSLPPGPFDLVLLDPPYAAGLEQPVLEELAAAGTVRPLGVIACETAAATPLSAPPGLREVDNRRYGAARLRLFQRE